MPSVRVSRRRTSLNHGDDQARDALLTRHGQAVIIAGDHVSGVRSLEDAIVPPQTVRPHVDFSRRSDQRAGIDFDKSRIDEDFDHRIDSISLLESDDHESPHPQFTDRGPNVGRHRGWIVALFSRRSDVHHDRASRGWISFRQHTGNIAPRGHGGCPRGRIALLAKTSKNRLLASRKLAVTDHQDGWFGIDIRRPGDSGPPPVQSGSEKRTDAHDSREPAMRLASGVGGQLFHSQWKVPLTSDQSGDTGTDRPDTMTTEPRALDVGLRRLIRAIAGHPIRLVTVASLASLLLAVADLDEGWATPWWVRAVIVIVGGLGLGSAVASAAIPSVASTRTIGRLLAVVYAVWWSALIVSLGTNHGPAVGVRDYIVPAVFFIGSFDVLGTIAGPTVLVALTSVALIVLSDRRSGRLRRLLPTSPRLRTRHLLAMQVSVGIFVVTRPVLDLLARQHVERTTLSASGGVDELIGPQAPLFVWTFITVATLGILVGTFWHHAGIRLVTSRRPAFNRPLLYASAVSLAFLVRLFTLLTVAPTRTDAGDPLFYHSTANLLANGLGFPEPLNFIAHQRWMASALHGPLYPFVLSFSSRFGGTTFFDHKMFSLVIGTAVVAFIGLVARQVASPERRDHIALTAMIFGAVYPNLWIVDGVLFPEGLMALLTTATVWAAFKWKSTPARRWALAMGALTGFAALTRGEGLLLAVLLIVPWVMLRRDIGVRTRLMHIVWAAVACIVVIAPWAIRNERSFEVSVPLSTNGNELFVYANCDSVYSGKFLGFWSFQCQEDLRDRGIDATGDEAEKSLFWRDIGFDYAREHAGELPKVVAARVARQWDLFRPLQNVEFAPIEGRDKEAARAGLFMYYGLAALTLVGVRNLRRRRVGLIPFASLFISVTITAAYAYGTTRFRIPAEPALCVLAAVGIFPIVDRLRRRFPSSDSHDDRTIAHPSPSVFVAGARPSIRNAFARTATKSWVSVGLVALTVATALPALFRAVGASMEEGFMLVFPERVLKGDIANVDFLHLYGPGSLHALAGWFEVFGTTLTSERFFGLFQHLLTISALYLLARPWGWRIATIVAASSTMFVLTPIGLQALAWSGGLGLGLWSMVFAVRSLHRESVGIASTADRLLAGLLAGLAVSFRPDLVVAVGLVLVFSLVRRPRRSWSVTLGGLIIGCTSIWVHLIQAGPRAFIEGSLIDPVFHLRPGRQLPRPPSWSHLDGALQIISEKVAPSWPLPHIGESKQLFLWFFLLPLTAILIFVVGFSALRRVNRRDEAGRTRALVLTAVGLMSIGLLPQAIQRPDSAHLLWVAALPWPFMVPTMLELVRIRRPRMHPTLRAPIALSIIAALTLIVAPSYTARPYARLVADSLDNTKPEYEISRNGRYFYLGDERPYLASKAVIDDLDEWSRPGERLLVGPVDLRNTSYSDAFFYHLFPDLTPATYYIEMDPGIADAVDSGLADDVRSADWLILTRFWAGWIEPNDSILFGSDEPNQVVERNFCLRGSYQYDLVRLYQRCAMGDDIGPYDPPYRPEYDYAVEVRVPVPARPDGTCTPTCGGSFDPEYAVIDTATVEPD